MSVASLAPADLLAHSRLLDSVAAFTHHRDTDALDRSLVLSLAELASARSVSLAKRGIEALQREAEKLDEQVKAKMRNLGVEPAPTTPGQFEAYIKSETTKWAKVIQQAHIKLGQ